MGGLVSLQTEKKSGKFLSALSRQQSSQTASSVDISSNSVFHPFYLVYFRQPQVCPLFI